MENGYSIKWINDLKMYSSIVSSFILEGNIHDLHPVEVDNKYLYLPVEQVIAKLLEDKYCVVYFDHTKKPASPVVPLNSLILVTKQMSKYSKDII